jgi:hypothetical protein
VAASVDFANDRNSGCFVRNADIGELGRGLGSRTPNAPDYAGAIPEVFDKGLICS